MDDDSSEDILQKLPFFYLFPANTKLRGGFSFKQQVMTDKSCLSSRLIGVETPALLLVFLNYFGNIFVMANLHADVFFQLNLSPP